MGSGVSRSRARADSKAVDNAKATCLTHNSDAKKSDGLRRSPVDKRQETDEKQHKQGQVADSSEAQAKVDASISREIRSDDETNLANSHAQSKDHIDRSDRADGEDYERIRNREYEEYRRRIEDGDEQEEEEEEDDNDESSKNSRPSNSGAAEIFMQTAMSLGMDNDDLLFNLMYFEEMGSAPPNFSSLLNSMQTETLALHSENNTPYKLNPASESAMDGLTRGTFSPQEHDQDKECDICKDEMEVGCRTAKVPHCGHYFHEECLIRWVKLQGWCPVCRVPLAGKTVSAAHGTAMEAVDENSEHGDVEITEAVSKKLLFDHCSDCVETHNAILSNKSDVKSQTMDHLDSKMVDSQFESRTDDASGDRTEEKGYLLQKDEVCEAKDSLYQMNYHDKESESKSEVYSVG